MKGGILLAALSLAGCAGAPIPVATTAEPQPDSAAERVVLALQYAAAAETRGDQPALARAVRIIDTIGARPLTETPMDPLPAWRAQVGNAEPPLRGRPLGPGYRSGRITAGGRDSFAQLFLSGTASSIALSSPTGDRVGLNVIDHQAKSVCRRDPPQGRACRWVPLFTQRYTIEVTNLGSGDARYFLVIE